MHKPNVGRGENMPILNERHKLLEDSEFIEDVRGQSGYAFQQHLDDNVEVDFQANGFKVMSNGTAINSAGNYLYMAWAHKPFGGSNVSPGTAQPG